MICSVEDCGQEAAVIAIDKGPLCWLHYLGERAYFRKFGLRVIKVGKVR